MTPNILEYIVIVFGAAVSAASVWGIVSPSGLITAVRTVFDNSWGMPLAVIVRLVLGAALILVAPEAKFPMFFKIVGGVVILTAILLPIIGKERIRRLLAWAEGWPVPGIRLWLLFGFAFGAFLIYGVL